jgi:hypothetical protein
MAEKDILYINKPAMDQIFMETEDTFRITEIKDTYQDYQGVICANPDRINHIIETHRTKNVRTVGTYKDKFNQHFYEFIGDVGHKHPSFYRENRGSFADPEQVFKLTMDVERRGLVIIGTIHGHMMFNPLKTNKLCYNIGDNATKFDFILWKLTLYPYHIISWNGRKGGCEHLMKSASAYKVLDDEHWERIELRVVVENKDYPLSRFYDLYESRDFSNW